MPGAMATATPWSGRWPTACWPITASGSGCSTDYRCPADQRIEAFLAEHFADLEAAPSRCACPAARSSSTGTAWRASCRCRPTATSSRATAARQLPRPQRRAAQPQERPPDDGGHVPRRRGRAADPRRQEGGAASASSPSCFTPRVNPPADAADAAVHRERRPSPRGAFVLAAAAAGRVPGGAGRLRREDDGGAVLRARQPGQQPRLRRIDLRQRRRPVPAARTTPASTSSTGPATPAASSSRRTSSTLTQEGARPAALRPGHRPAAARRHVLEGRGRDVQRRHGRSSSPAARRRA